MGNIDLIQAKHLKNDTAYTKGEKVFPLDIDLIRAKYFLENEPLAMRLASPRPTQPLRQNIRRTQITL